MTSPAHKIATHLDSDGFGTIGSDSGTTISVSREPSSPDEAITIYDTGGLSPDTDTEDFLVRTIQIRLRTNNYNSGYVIMENIRDNLLAEKDIVSVNQIFMDGDILFIGRDDNDRFLLTANYRLLM